MLFISLAILVLSSIYVNANVIINNIKEVNTLPNFISNSKYLVVGEYGYTQDCHDTIQSRYSDCINLLESSGISSPDLSTRDKICFAYSNNICSDLIQNGIPEECKESSTISQIVEGRQLTYYGLCGKDDEGNYCPYSEQFLLQTMTMTQIAENSCYSNQCASYLKKTINFPLYTTIFGNEGKQDVIEINNVECIKNIELKTPELNDTTDTNNAFGLTFSYFLIAIFTLINYFVTQL